VANNLRDLMTPAHPFDTEFLRTNWPGGDDDKLKEECGVFGVVGVDNAASVVALGLHALQHRGQEAGGIVTHEFGQGFSSARRFGYVRDNFTDAETMATLPGPIGIGHVR
jgi:amidophosphoribosyltransferase